MDRTTLALLTHELRNQCIYTEAAFRVFNQSLEQKAVSGAFFAAQSILLSASQIGCMLWPPRARSRKRGEAFRKVLQLPEKHPLNDKRLLAIWEHSDEKFDDWVGRTKGQRIVFDHVGPLSDFADSSVTEESVYRLYDPVDMLLYFRGDGFKLQAIANAISDIYSRANSLHRQFFPDQQPRDQQTDDARQASGAKKVSVGTSKDKAKKKPPAKKKGKSPAAKSSPKKSPPKKSTAKKSVKSKKAK
ncbi:MAG: hypothetical protein IID51_00130 [Proteobacteria bacterium]|nr:hypothetical protein [Pseudomonadota bacterium]